MDWSKAKTILIVALIITNLFLAYFLFWNQPETDSLLSPQFLEEVEELLGRNGIVLDTEIPVDQGELYNLTVEYETFTPTALNERFFGSQGLVDRGQGAITEIEFGLESVSVINNKLLIYENEDEFEETGPFTLEDAAETARKFLEDRGYNTEDMGLSFWRETQTGYYLDFTKIFQDSYIEHSYTVFRIEGGKVRRMERTWLNTKEIEQTDYKIVPAPKAILELLSMEDTRDKTIVDISVCYYFDPEKQEYLGDYQQATEGRAVPAWRIQFEDGYDVILDLE